MSPVETVSAALARMSSRANAASQDIMQVTYKASVLRDPFGSFIAVFDDVLDAVGMGDSEEQALADAVESLQIALESRLMTGLPLPFPRAAAGRDVTIALSDDASPILKICA